MAAGANIPTLTACLADLESKVRHFSSAGAGFGIIAGPLAAEADSGTASADSGTDSADSGTDSAETGTDSADCETASVETAAASAEKGIADF